jgi:pimeloyl-ACP methyl ester carboxylesterase
MLGAMADPGVAGGGYDSAWDDLELPELDEHLPPWPGAVEESGGVRLHVRRTEPELTPDGAPTAVYVHGLGGSSTNWTDLGRLLAPWARGVAVDLPGFGLSEPEDGFDYSLRAHADRVARFVRGFGDGPVHVLGNSMGGAIAILLAARWPELVRSVTLVSPAVPDLRPSIKRLSDPRLALAYLPVIGTRARQQLIAMTPEQRVRQVIELCYHDPSRLPPHRLAEMVEEYRQRSGHAWAVTAMGRSTLGIVRDWVARGPRSLWRALEEITAPSLVVWGERDRVISARKAVRTVRALRRGRLLMLPDTGHVAQMEQPRRVAQATVELWREAEAGR